MGLPKRQGDRRLSRTHNDTTGDVFGVQSEPNKKRFGGSLRSQLLDRVAILLTLALLALAVVMLVWLPRATSPQVLLVSLLSLIALDVALVLVYGDSRLRRLVVRPVARMVEQAEAIARGKYDQRLECSGAGELKRLAESVNAMADRLIHNQEQLKRNVQSLHATNRELVLTRRELVHAEKLATVGRMTAGIAHEIGNPLGGLIGYLEVARRRRSGDTEWIDAVEGEAQRIDRVVHGLLDFARPRRARVTEFDVNGVVRETVKLIQAQGRLKTVRVETDLELPGATVRGDPQHLEQILVNLLLNADDAIREAGAPGRITVVTSTSGFTDDADEPVRRDGDPDGTAIPTAWTTRTFGSTGRITIRRHSSNAGIESSTSKSPTTESGSRPRSWITSSSRSSRQKNRGVAPDSASPSAHAWRLRSAGA